MVFFDATEVDPNDRGFTPVPAGKYLAAITASEIKPNKANTGSYTQFEFTILAGDQKGRKIYERLNIDNPNDTAKKIAKADLSAICHAVGVLRPENKEALHDLPLVIDVAVTRSTRNGKEYVNNEIKKYEPRPKPGSEETLHQDGDKPSWV